MWQTGKKNFDDVCAELKQLYPEFENDKNLVVKPYFENMFIPLCASDLVVSRAGSVSLSEICLSSSPSILIPYPHAAQDHQRKNAKYMEENGAGLYLEDAETTPEKLLEYILKLSEDKQKRESIRNSALKMAKFSGVEKIIEQIEECSIK